MTMSDEDRAHAEALNADALRLRTESREATRKRDTFFRKLYEERRADKPDLREVMEASSRNAVHLIVRDTARARAERQDAEHVRHAAASRARVRAQKRRR